MEARLVSIEPDGSHKDIGIYEFLELPRRGDQVVAGFGFGIGIYEVMYVEHSPILLPISKSSPPLPTARVFVRLGDIEM